MQVTIWGFIKVLNTKGVDKPNLEWARGHNLCVCLLCYYAGMTFLVCSFLNIICLSFVVVIIVCDVFLLINCFIYLIYF